MKNNLNQIIKDNIAKNTKVVLAFSSGPDSVYLLHKLLEIKGIEIILAHFNHQLRGKDSDLDEKFAQKTAKNHNLKLENASFDIKNYAKKNSLNLEEAARKKRYEFLRRIKQKHGASLILTAHHANDNLETFLLNFLRGSGLSGLKSMQLINKDIFRPLLYTSKKEILEFLKKNKINFRVDKSNNDTRLNRNKLRHEVIPKLEEIQPDLINVFNRNIQNINEINGLIKNRAQNDAFTKEILVNLYENLYGSTKNLTSKQIEKALKLIKNKKTGKKAEFGKDLYLTTTSKSVQIIPKTKAKTIKKQKLPTPGTINFEYGQISSKLKKTPPKKGIYFDYSKLKLPLYVRGKLDGDRFRPFGLKGTKKLQDFFTDKKIPKHERSKIPIITDKNDEIIAVGNYTINDNYKISKSNKESSDHCLEILLKIDKL
ncbi:tRNA lysidine(34) synthetase TilS [Patescibacteria group bacterium]